MCMSIVPYANTLSQFQNNTKSNVVAVCAGMSGGEQSSVESKSESLLPELSRRDLNNVLTQMCCQMGCRKNDLMHLC